MEANTTPIYVVTGATGVMGRVIVKRLAEQGKPLLLACRSMKSGEELASSLRQESGNADITAMLLDLSSFADVKQFVEQVRKMNRPVAALINNAAHLSRKREKTVDGYERTIQVNFLSTALLSLLFKPLMIENGRIVMTTSPTRNFTSLPYEFPAVNNYVPFTTFAQSKLALTLFSIYLSTTLRHSSINVNCADPGLINTGLLSLGNWMYKVSDRLSHTLIHNPEDGAIATLRALESSDTGFIFKGLDRQVKVSTLLKNREVFAKLCTDTMRILKKYI